MPEETTKAAERKDAEKKRRLLGIEPIETHHELVLGDRRLKYTARAGAIPLKDEWDETEAEIFFTAYELDGVEDRSTRPLTFAFNGGPGSASIWLHMGALGPKRVQMEKEGWMPRPPFRYEDNPQTWLDQTDLVFIDPAGTGFSRAAKEELDKKFWSFQGDVDSVGEFIRLYLTRYKRWNSPLFMAGERATARRGPPRYRDISQIGASRSTASFLISTVLDHLAIRFLTANDLPFQLFVPTYAATAWYHQRLAPALQRRPLVDLVAEVKAWSEGDLTSALMKGDRLSSDERRAVAKTLADYIGLDPDYVLGTNLRVDIFRFCKELLRYDKRSVGRLDSRFKGVEASAATERFEFDPSMQAITGPYTAALNHYLRSELGVETDLVYETLSGKINEKWEYESGRPPATGEILRSAMAKNPYMKVFVGQGYYDLATPLFATEYMLSHMNVDAELRSNVEMHHYESGHMFYIDEGCLEAFKRDVEEFIRACAGA